MVYQRKHRNASFEETEDNMRTFKIRNITIGEGTPKLCVPLVGTTHDEIVDFARLLTGIHKDLVEWRADWYEDVFSIGKVMEIIVELREILGGCPILFTFRTRQEGGEKEISIKDYAEILQDVATTGLIELLDIEMFQCPEDVLKDIIATAHEAGVIVIGSSHDFEKTAPREELVGKLRKMQELGADIPKLAVMPNSKWDTLTLLEATLEMKERYADRPIITMAMGKDGIISRAAGEIFGSDVTFGSVGRASAPGQLPSEELGKVLSIFHHAME